MIGVFDSGIGGLTVLTKILERLPESPLIYVADQAHAPYGDLSETNVDERVRVISRWLIEQGAELIVVACNTATAISIDRLRTEFSVPFVGVEPGVKPAVLSSQTQKVGILATENTVASKRYQSLIERFIPNAMVLSQGCSGLVDAIEYEPAKVTEILSRYVSPMIEFGVDQIVLGCTHYPLIKPQLQTLLGSQASIVDTSDAVAQEVARRYPATGNYKQSPKLRLLTTGSTKHMRQIIECYSALTSLSNVEPELLLV